MPCNLSFWNSPELVTSAKCTNYMQLLQAIDDTDQPAPLHHLNYEKFIPFL